MSRAQDYDWPYIRGLYEAGSTAYQLGKRPGFPTKQAIQSRADKEGWTKAEMGSAHRLPIIAEALNIRSHKLTDELLTTLLNLLAEGATIETACAVVGITDNTLRNWCRQDPEMKALIRRARAGTVASWQNTIHRATEKDWKAATWLLQNSPDTRKDFGAHQQDSTIEVVININRDEPTVIEGTCTADRPSRS